MEDVDDSGSTNYNLPITHFEYLKYSFHFEGPKAVRYTCTYKDGTVCMQGFSLLPINEVGTIMNKHFQSAHLDPIFNRIRSEHNGLPDTHRGFTLEQAVELSKSGRLKEMQAEYDLNQIQKEHKRLYPPIPLLHHKKIQL